MLTPLRVLIVEDLEDDALLLIRALKKSGYDPLAERVQTAEDMTLALMSWPWDIILCDYHMPGFSGIDAIALLKKLNLDIPLIVVSGAIGEETALDCIHRGASDYIMKGNLARLGLAIQQELDRKEMRARQKKDEEALRESEEKFKTIANYTVDWESWFGPDGTYLWVNPGVERITGYSAPEVLAMRDFISVIIAEEDRELFLKHFRDALTGTRGENFEIQYLHKNGAKLWLSVSWQPVFDAAGSFLGIRTSGREISAVKQAEEERRNLEKQLFVAQKMEAIGALAGGIAHDFNNILSGIMGYAELALQQPDPDARQRSIQQILNAAERAKNLVQQILAFSRPAGQDKKPMALQPVIREAMKLLRATIPKTIDMQLHVTAQPVVINADYTQIHQIIMNICTNAAHAMGEKGGVLDVSLAPEDLADERAGEFHLKPGNYVRLSISDTGRGIDPAIIDRIFDPFFTTRESGEGTGLGLSVVYGIVKNHNGLVQVESEQGLGTTFHIYLPALSAPKAAAAESFEAEPVPRGHEHILFVDDEEDIADLMQTILTELGYLVTTCTDSREAIRIYQSDPRSFDLVITDMTMPHLSGSDLARQIIRIRPGQPVILCTGYSSYMNAEKAANLGITAFLFKPVPRRELAVAIRKALDEKTAVSDK
ncbi:MAG: response regulator [Deltaproteobacteria bacterium]